MSDVHDKITRSYNMSRIKATDTKPEMLVRKFLHENGVRYRLHDKSLPGKPDIVLKKYRTVIFVNGCFWHGHKTCKYFVLPKTGTEWWENKIEETINRDVKNTKKIQEFGWTSIVIWECELKRGKRNKTLENILHILNQT
jgi:DNA mismatch endonuclease (patch repair protein)